MHSTNFVVRKENAPLTDVSSRGVTFTWWGCSGLLPTPFYSVPVYFCLYGPFNCISVHKVSRQLAAFSLCSPGLKTALLAL